MAVFGLALAYRRVDDDEGRACKWNQTGLFTYRSTKGSEGGLFMFGIQPQSILQEEVPGDGR